MCRTFRSRRGAILSVVLPCHNSVIVYLKRLQKSTTLFSLFFTKAKRKKMTHRKYALIFMLCIVITYINY